MERGSLSDLEGLAGLAPSSHFYSNIAAKDGSTFTEPMKDDEDKVPGCALKRQKKGLLKGASVSKSRHSANLYLDGAIRLFSSKKKKKVHLSILYPLDYSIRMFSCHLLLLLGVRYYTGVVPCLILFFYGLNESRKESFFIQNSLSNIGLSIQKMSNNSAMPGPRCMHSA